MSLSLSEWNRNVTYNEMQQDEIQLTKDQNTVLSCIESHTNYGGITDHEISTITGMCLSGVNGRRNELVKKGLVRSQGSDTYYNDRGHKKNRTLWVKM